MTGFVFIVCVPNGKFEAQLKSKSHRRVFIKTTGRKISSSSDSIFKNKSSSDDDDDDEVIADVTESSPNRDNYQYVSMEKLVHDILVTYRMEKTAWSHNLDSNFVQMIFTIEAGEKCEEILEILKDHNVGLRYESTISIIPCSLYYQGCENTDETFTVDNEDEKKDVPDTAWTRFVSSVRARLTVAQIVEVLKSEAAVTFDFICLLVIATILCAIGLVENSNVYLLSSMLISPMMGPVMAGTFGSVIRDRMLLRIGVQSELVGLGTATLVGFCYGAIICMCTDKYGEVDWPTNEMISRGEVRTLGVGCLIALLSGAAVAVGILSDNIASLVGVAISTSLMPPAVNAGLLWSLATVYYVKGNETTRYASLSYTEFYSTDRFVELTTLGAISLCLTFVNIICIYFAGILVFKIKEVAPISSKDHARRQFWKHDIKVTRNYNKTLQKEEAKKMKAKFLKELGMAKRSNRNQNDHHLHHSTEINREEFEKMEKKMQYTWSPCTIVSKRPTIQELQDLYNNLVRDSPKNSPKLLPKAVRKLSQIFANSSDIASSRDNVLISISEPSTSSHQLNAYGRKFTVTPCELDVPTI